MDRSDVIYLLTASRAQDSLGVWHTQTVSKRVFCEVTSVSQSEWFEGGRNGLNPEFRFRLFRYDYNGEDTAIYNGEVYSIYRTYIDKNELIDLYVQKKKGANGGESPSI